MKTKLNIKVHVNIALVIFAITGLINTIAFIYQNLV